jgi:OmpA-OmpF porin, OOP family
MRCNPWRWLWGLIPILMLSFVAYKVHRPLIEEDLRQRAAATLTDAGYDWANVKFSGRDAILVGRAADEGSPRKAIDAVKSVWGVRVVRARTDLLGTVENYVWNAARRNRRVIVGGFVPTAEDRRRVVRQVKSTFPNFDVVDEMRLGRSEGEIGNWLAKIGFALEQLKFVSRGRTDVTPDVVRVTGEARDFTSYKTLGAQLAGNLPAGLRNAQNDVTPPVVDPFQWLVDLKPKQLTFSGHVPREDVREQLFAQAKTKFPKSAIVDRMDTARGAPRGWDRVAQLVLTVMEKMTVGRAEMVARDLTIEGEAPDEETASSIVSQLRRQLPETYKLVENITFPKPVYPVVSPYVTTMKWVDGELVLTGSAPNETARSALAKAVRDRFPNLTVVNRLNLASGAPEGWNTCVVAGLASILKFDQGMAQLVDRRLILESATRSEVLYNSTLGEMRAAANRACDAQARLELLLPEEPRLTWRAARADQEIILEGEVPSAETKLKLVDDAGRIFPNLRLVDRMEVVPSPSQRWHKVAELGLRMLARLRSGEAVLHDSDLLVRGEASDTATATSVKAALGRETAKGFTSRERLIIRSDAMIWSESEAAQRAKEEARRTEEEAERRRREAEASQRREEQARRLAAAEEERRLAEQEAERQRREAEDAERARKRAQELASKRLRQEAERERREEEQKITQVEREVEAQQCQQALAAAAERGRILFDFARSTLRASSRPTLDELARLAKNCPVGIIQVAGHTDSDGGEAANQKLSESRAAAIVRYLANAGVDRSRLRSVGFGESRPVAPNTSSQNKAKNRRIEFEVLLN